MSQSRATTWPVGAAARTDRVTDGQAEDLDRGTVLGDGEVEAGRVGVLVALVGRQVGVVPEREEAARVEAGLLGRVHHDGGALEGVRDG